MAGGVWKEDHSGVFEPSYQLSLNKFFDPSTPSMRKERNRGEKNGKKKERMMKIVATDVVPVEPTGTPTARAKRPNAFFEVKIKALLQGKLFISIQNPSLFFFHF